MNHLSIEEIIDYVMANKVDNETLELLSKVNGHIRKCPACKELVESYEKANDELKKEILRKEMESDFAHDFIEEKKLIEDYCR